MKRMKWGIFIIALTVLAVWDIQSHSIIQLEGYDYIRVMFYDAAEMIRYGRSGYDFRLMMYNVFMVELTLLMMLGKWGEMSGGFASLLFVRLHKGVQILYIQQRELFVQNLLCTVFEGVQAGICILIFTGGRWKFTSVTDMACILLFLTKRICLRQFLSLSNVLALRGARQEWILILQIFILVMFINVDIQCQFSLIAYTSYGYQLAAIGIYGMVYIVLFAGIRKWIGRKELA